MCALGLPDRPPGMRTLVTKTLDAILKFTRHPILPNMSIHLAIRQFIEIAWLQKDLTRKRSKAAFVALLCTLCGKMREDPSLAGIFFDEHPHKPNVRGREGGREDRFAVLQMGRWWMVVL